MLRSQDLIGRRDFLKVSASAGGGLLISLCLPGEARAQATEDDDPADAGAEDAFEPSVLLRIDPDDSVTLFSKNPEMGQGIKTALPMILAEELGADWGQVRVEQADLDRRFGPQFSGGSIGVVLNYDRMRRAGATARVLLVSAAARGWSVDEAECSAEHGTVLHRPSGRRRSFGQLASAAAALPLPANAPLKPAGKHRIVGTDRPRVDLPGILTGRPLFGLDTSVPGMLVACIEKAPTFGGMVRKVDATAARAVPGVRDVVTIEALPNPTHLAAGVAVLAESTWAALQGRKALSVTWSPGPRPDDSSDALREQFQERTSGTGKLLRDDGDVQAALAGAAQTLEAVYELPFVAHATLEPMNCVADVRADRCEIWGPLQVPGGAHGLAAQLTGLPPEAIAVHMTRCGGGFGRRLMSDFAAEAVYLSKAVGAPVQVVWTREDDTRHDYYRPASYHRLRAGLDEQGTPVAWHLHLSSASRYLFRQDDGEPEDTEVFPDAFPAGFVPNLRLEYSAVTTPVPTGAWRGPGVVANAFADQCFLDEIAAAGGRDPLELRLSLLGEARDVPYRDHGGPTYNTGRLARVLRLAAQKAGWGTAPARGRALGIAAHFTFGSYAAEVAEVSADEEGRVRVHHVVAAVDCGTLIHPSAARAQVEGGVLQALSVALHEAVPIRGGRAEPSNFHDYPLLRHDEAPDVEVHFVPSAAPPTGLGEIPLPPLAPAVCNALFAATGRRVRRLPISMA